MSDTDLAWIGAAWPIAAVALGAVLLACVAGFAIARTSAALHRLRLLAEQAVAGQRT